MRAAPLVSIITLSRNNGQFIREALESALNQTYANWELIVIENGSTDESPAIVEDLAAREPRIRMLRLPQTVNIPVARNLGLARARGDYVATLDSDDVWLPARLSRQVEYLDRGDNASVGVCGANCLVIDAGSDVIGRKDFPSTHEECMRALWRRNPFCHSATLVRRLCFDRCGGYDESFEVAQDLDLWFRIGSRFRLGNLNEYLVKYRIWGASVTFGRHQAMVRHTLRARRLAAARQGQRMTARDGFAFGVSWCMQWLPPQIVHRLFYGLVLRQPLGKYGHTVALPMPISDARTTVH